MIVLQVIGPVLGVLLIRRFRSLPGLLRAAVFAQIADFVTFAIVWTGFQKESNPLANLILQTVVGLAGGEESELASLTAGLVLIGLKIALIGYLVWAAPILGRYRRLVLVAALAAGVVGALSNLRLFGIFIGPGNVPLL
jgi:hypothetical protein